MSLNINHFHRENNAKMWQCAAYGKDPVPEVSALL
jgi:hypothetical protein